MKTRSAKKAKTTPKRTTEIKSAKKSRQSTASAGSEKMQKAQIQSRRSTYFWIWMMEMVRDNFTTLNNAF